MLFVLLDKFVATIYADPKIIEKSGAKLSGTGIVIEKYFQWGKKN